MTPMHTRIAAGAAAFLFAVAAADIGVAMAQETPSTSGSTIATTCGAGTKEHCGEAPVTVCDWTFDIGYNATSGFHVKIGKVDCKVTGKVPIYKNNDRDAYMLSGSCNLLNPFLGMPAGSGCSEE